MKKTILFMALILATGFLVVAPAMAGSIAKKQAAQRQRIQQGLNKGSLTRAEARVLQKEQRKIGKVKKRFLADEVLTKGERRKLAALQKRAGHNIRRLKHNAKVRPQTNAQRRDKGSKRKIYYLLTEPGQSLGRPV